MSTIYSATDSYSYSYEADLPPGSDNPVENAGDQQPPPSPAPSTPKDSSAEDYYRGVQARIDANITAGNYDVTGPYSATVYNGAHNNPNNQEDNK
jgi:hypothetical protein